MRWPVISFDALYHVGTMDPAAKSCNFETSYEGDDLSVSTEPEAWEQIAKLGGNPWWRLSRPEAQLLDVLRLTRPQRQSICTWAERQGLIEPITLWRASWFDDEMDQRVALDFRSADEARGQVEGEEGSRVRKVAGWGALPTLVHRLHWEGWTDLAKDGAEGAIIAFAEDVLAVDGLWWAEELAPENLSAPRGVIFAARLDGWGRENLTARQGLSLEGRKRPTLDEEFDDELDGEGDGDVGREGWIEKTIPGLAALDTVRGRAL
jgi:hypothetical protein